MNDNILLVDDQQAKLLSHEAILEEIGENLLKASSARQARSASIISIHMLVVSAPRAAGRSRVSRPTAPSMRTITSGGSGASLMAGTSRGR